MKIHSKKKPSVLFVAAAALLAAVAATGCTLHEKTEIIRCPQTDIGIPEANLWNAVQDSNTGTGH